MPGGVFLVRAYARVFRLELLRYVVGEADARGAY